MDDPFIFDLMTECGGDGYLTFFGILEIYAREFKPELGWKLRITRSYLKQKLCKRQDTLVIKSLKHIKNSGKWDVEITDKEVSIYIPKFAELLDEWTSRKIGSKSGVTPEILSDKQKQTQSKIENKDKSIQTDISTGIIEPKKELVIKKLQEAFLKFPDIRYQQQIKVFVEANLFKKNGDAIIQALNSLIKSQQKIINPKMYLDKVLAVENGNFNEQESVQEHEEHKKPIQIERLKGLGNVLQGMGAT